MLARKQTVTHEDFVATLRAVDRVVSRAELDNLIDVTVDEIRRTIKGRVAAFSWSGGKDSIALEHVCALADVEPCVLGLTDLEVPAFVQWCTDHMPPGLEVVNVGLDLDWLALHPGMLFPTTSAIAGRWFNLVQRADLADGRIAFV